MKKHFTDLYETIIHKIRNSPKEELFDAKLRQQIHEFETEVKAQIRAQISMAEELNYMKDKLAREAREINIYLTSVQKEGKHGNDEKPSDG